jgi:Spy/CpxP family protein refolding chaperone
MPRWSKKLFNPRNNMTLFTKKWIGGLLTLALLFAAAFLLIGWRMQDVASDMSEKVAPSSSLSLFEELKLSDVQKKQVRALEEQYQSEVAKCCKEHCSARDQIARRLEANAPLEEILGLQKQVSHAYSSSEEATLRHVMRVCEILTPEQKKVFLQKFATSISVHCPMKWVQ